jgi:putative flippase GtrA
VKRPLRFALGGVLGFIVDSAVLHVLMAGAGLGPYAARVPSFLAAATCTWLVGRYWTFADLRGARRGREWRRWIAAMAIGGGLNYAVYAAAVAGSATVRGWPVLGVAAGSLAGMVVNYLTARWWVFAGAGPTTAGR